MSGAPLTSARSPLRFGGRFQLVGKSDNHILRLGMGTELAEVSMNIRD